MNHEACARFLAEKKLQLRPLDEDHLIEYFTCGRDENMDRWLSEHARYWHRENLCRVWIMSQNESPDVPIGFFTLSASQISPELIPKRLRADHDHNRSWINNLDNAFPATLLGKFALEEQSQKQGLGNVLMFCVYATHLEAAQHTGSKFVILDVQNSSLEAYYSSRFKFLSAQRSGKYQRMIKSTKSIAVELTESLTTTV